MRRGVLVQRLLRTNFSRKMIVGRRTRRQQFQQIVNPAFRSLAILQWGGLDQWGNICSSEWTLRRDRSVAEADKECKPALPRLILPGDR